MWCLLLQVCFANLVIVVKSVVGVLVWLFNSFSWVLTCLVDNFVCLLWWLFVVGSEFGFAVFSLFAVGFDG